jgi:AmmeMemoRadiSam system protein B
MMLMQQQGGVLVSADEVERVLAELDASYLLESERFLKAKEEIVSRFVESPVRPCSHCGRAYPDSPEALRERLDEILHAPPISPPPEARLKALIAPHIDLSAGTRVYSSAYGCLRQSAATRVIVLGVGHQMRGDLFCMTEKDFETPLGTLRTDKAAVERLSEAGGAILAENDFVFKHEHSVEFQVLFLQHLMAEQDFTLVPLLCGPLLGVLSEYSRGAYLAAASPFLEVLSGILAEADEETLVVAGVDFSHIGPKFGHDRPATYLEARAEAHDQALLNAISAGDASAFWQESIRVEDAYNVCGFSAVACLLEVLPPSPVHILGHQFWHEAPTQSAVSFAAVAFTE